MRTPIYILFITFFLLTGIVTANTSPQVIQKNKTQGLITDNSTKLNFTASDQQFLFLMNQYWIPDLYDIRGRLDGAAGFGEDVPQMLNLSLDYARIRLKRNINETNGYSISPTVSGLRTQYQKGAFRSIEFIDEIMKMNRSEEFFIQNVTLRTAAISLYGTWLEYQVIRCYNLPNISYPEIAGVPPDKFMQVMKVITP